MRNRHRISGDRFSNCIIPMIVLMLKRRIVRIVSIRKHGSNHYMGVTKKDNLIHFTTTEQHDKYAPYVFEGYLQSVGKFRFSEKLIHFTSVFQFLRYLIYGYKPNNSNQPVGLRDSGSKYTQSFGI